MSTTHATPAPVRSSRSVPVLGWVLGGVALVAVLIAVAVAVWPASAEEEARTDGERIGAAVTDLYNADTTDEVDAALTELGDASATAVDHAGDRLDSQIEDQADALARAADGFAGVVTAGDSFEQDLYQVELDDAVADLDSQASDFRSAGPEVEQAFWEGVDAGLTID
jgi:hypothetical protein